MDIVSNKHGIISVEDGKLFFGNKEVLTDTVYESVEDAFRQPLYGIRVPTESMLEWVTGLDLKPDGSLWLGPIQMSWEPHDVVPQGIHDRLHDITFKLNYLCRNTKGKEWVIIEDKQYTHEGDFKPPHDVVLDENVIYFTEYPNYESVWHPLQHKDFIYSDLDGAIQHVREYMNHRGIGLATYDQMKKNNAQWSNL